MIKKIIIAFWALLVIVAVSGFFIFSAIADGKIGYMPPVEELENPTYKFATQIFSEDGELLGTWSLSKENRVYTAYNDLPANLINALIATEDIRFADHSGIDAKGLARAVIKRGILQQQNAGGGSTITQQLAKLLYTEETAKNYYERAFQKPIEWVIAVKLERYYTKEEILTMYLNKFDFLNNAVGINTAAHTYFNVDPKNLKIEEAATLIGMCKNPSYFNPRRFNERAKGRRNVVLDQMFKAGFISEQEKDSLQLLPLELKYNPVDHKLGIATYLREYLRGVISAQKPVKSNYRGWQMQKFYEDSLAWETNPLYGWCNKHKKRDGSNYSLYTDGLKIYTTINSRMQKYAEEAVAEHMTNLQERFFQKKKNAKNAPYANSLNEKQVKDILERSVRQSERYVKMKAAGKTEAEIRKAFNTPEEMSVYTWHGNKDTIMTPMDSIKYYKHFLRTGFMSMNPINGHVKAYVGGINYTYFQYDMAMVGRRQIGSTIKPFLYTLAMENGFTPCDEARKVEITLIQENGLPWSPRNSDPKKRYGEMVTLKWGLANSDNWISAYLMGKLNPYALAGLIHNFGVLNRDIPPVVSLCLGPCEISVGEMVSAYTAFANKGIRVAPLFVTRIEDNEGNILDTFSPDMDEVISVSSSYKMLDMMKAVVNEGTANRAKRIYKIEAEMGGKTGTTNDNSDGWFIGFTPSLVSGVWVGGEDRDIHFDAMRDGQGAEMALPIWGLYMQKVLNDKSLGYDPQERFQFPKDYKPCGDSNSETFYTPDQGGLDELFN